MSAKKEFIESSIFDIIQEFVAACECISKDGIESYPIINYGFEATLLKLTGFSEQKLRFIDWEIGSNDLEYRYQLLQGRITYGEFSRLDDKKNLYNVLCSKSKSSAILDQTIKNKILSEVKLEMEMAFDKSFLSQSFHRDYEAFFTELNSWKTSDFAAGKTLMSGGMADRYEALYKQRNRCAHNTLSYQQDTISLLELKDTKMPANNYFTYYALLLLLDKVFIEAYQKFLIAVRYSC